MARAHTNGNGRIPRQKKKIYRYRGMVLMRGGGSTVGLPPDEVRRLLHLYGTTAPR